MLLRIVHPYPGTLTCHSYLSHLLSLAFGTQVTANDAAVVATAQPITKDLADSVAHTAAIHSRNFARRRYAEAAHHNTAMASLPIRQELATWRVNMSITWMSAVFAQELPVGRQALGCCDAFPWFWLLHAAHISVNNNESVNMQHAYTSTCRCSGIPL